VKEKHSRLRQERKKKESSLQGISRGIAKKGLEKGTSCVYKEKGEDYNPVADVTGVRGSAAAEEHDL